LCQFSGFIATRDDGICGCTYCTACDFDHADGSIRSQPNSLDCYRSHRVNHGYHCAGLKRKKAQCGNGDAGNTNKPFGRFVIRQWFVLTFYRTSIKKATRRVAISTARMFG
jgi:hypothetical protein